MRNFFNELKRRNVYKVAVAYLIAAWLILQVAAVLLPTFEAPVWILKTLTLLLILGFPMAAVFAWAFEITPEGIKRTRQVPLEHSIARSTGHKLNKWIIGILSLAVIALLIDSIVLRNGLKAPIFRAVEKNAKVVFAVMPFDVQSSGSLDYLKEGVVDLLSTKLDNSGELQSLDPNIVLTQIELDDRHIRDPKYAVSRLKEFGANRYVLGSINELGQEITFNASLYDASGNEINRVQVKSTNPSQLPSALDDLTFLLLSKELEKQGKELESVAAFSTHNLDALKAFLIAEQHRRKGAYENAVQFLDEALTLDSTFAMAWLQRRHLSGWLSSSNFANQIAIHDKVEKYKAELPKKYLGLHEVYVHFLNNQGQEAMLLLDQLIIRYGEDIDLILIKGEILYHLFDQFDGDPFVAKPYLQQANAYEPENLEPLEHLFTMAFFENNLENLEEIYSQFPRESTNWYIKQLLRHIALGDSIDRSDLENIFLHPSYSTVSLITNGVQEKSILPMLKIVERASREIPSVANDPFLMFFDIMRGREGLMIEKGFQIDSKARFGLIGSTFQLEDIYTFIPELIPQIKDLPQTDMPGIHPILYYMYRAAYARQEGDKPQFAMYMDSIKTYWSHADPKVRQICRYTFYFQRALEEFKQENYPGAISYIDSVNTQYLPFRYRESVFPLYSSPKMVKAESLFRLGDYQLALKEFNGFNYLSTPLNFIPLRGQIYLRKGQIHAELGNSDEALKYLNLFIELYKGCDERFLPLLDEGIAKREKVFAKLQ